MRCSSSSLIELVSGEGTEGKRRGHWQAGGGNGEGSSGDGARGEGGGGSTSSSGDRKGWIW